jgi:glucan 1,3-beta-glucosidase
MAHEEAHHQVHYDPLVDESNSPRLSTPANVSPQPTPAAEFGAPNPGYFSGAYNDSSAASSTGNFRASNYGSLAPLQRDSSYIPPTTVYNDEEGTFANQNNPDLVEKDVLYAAPRTKSKRKFFWIAGLACAAILLIAIIVPVIYFTAIKKGGGSGGGSGGGGGGGGHSGNHPQSNFATWGGDGSTVTTSNGSTFTYHNSFDGYWVFDPQNPLNNSARAQSYTPPISEQWPWGQQPIYGCVFLFPYI